jgi:hypothetical protein
LYVNARWLFWWRPPCLLQRVLVNLAYTPDEALQGVLFASRGGWITLKSVSAIRAGVPTAPIEGDVVIHLSKVAFFQVLPS